MRVAYLDAFSGLSGDMIVGALLDCGLEIGALERELAKLGLTGYRIGRERRSRSGTKKKFLHGSSPCSMPVKETPRRRDRFTENWRSREQQTAMLGEPHM